MSLRSLLSRLFNGDIYNSHFISTLNEISSSKRTYDADIIGTPAHENSSVGARGVFNSVLSGQETVALEQHNDRVAAHKFLRDHGKPPQLMDAAKQGGPLPPNYNT